MPLATILPADVFAKLPQAIQTVAPTGVCADTRLLMAGEVFFAMRGTHHDGAKFIDEALAKGASLVFCAHKPARFSQQDNVIAVDNIRALLSYVAARFYSAQPANIICVTGTSGKTSVAEFTRQLWAHLGFKAASLGTLGLVQNAIIQKGALTTPDPIGLHKILVQVHDLNITHLAMEASSHGLEQHRLDGVRFQACAFTNLTRDHLDYHGTMEAYFAAKLRLLDLAKANNAALVVDADSQIAPRVCEEARARGLPLFTTGRLGKTISCDDVKTTGAITLLTLRYEEKTYVINFPLLGSYQIRNALVAAGLVIACGGDPQKVLPLLEKLTTVRGRLERVGELNKAQIVIDYAHKPDALEHVLSALRPYATGKLRVVFGCGGDRDAGKRAIMGEIAARLADTTIITDDNPRSEEASLIRAMIKQGAPHALEIGDRREAITFAMRALQHGDILLIAGKGHEEGQIIGDKILPFSDHAVVREILAEKNLEARA